MRNIRSELMLYFMIVMVILLTISGGISYSQTKQIIISKVSESTLENLKQIDKNLNSMVGDIQDISLFVVSNSNTRNFLKMNKDDFLRSGQIMQYLNDDLANLANSKSFISSISIYGDNDFSYETAGPSNYAQGDLQEFYEKTIPKEGSYIITPTYRRYYQAMGMQYVMSFYRQINDINNFSQRLGIVRIDVNENLINKIYKDIKVGNTGYIFIVNKSGNIVSHSNKQEITKNVKDKTYLKPIFSSNQGYYRESIEGKDVLITYYTSKVNDLVLVSVVPFEELIKEVSVVREMTIFVIIIASFLAFLLSYFISNKITTPIKKLTQIMQKVEAGNLEVTADVKRKDEIGALGRSFNSMISRINTLIEEVYKIKISKKEAELRALQAQINPHFLYNTLDVIYWTSRIEGAPKTGEIVNALAKLFRLALNKGNEITTIEKEVEHLNNYLIIQKIRYEEEPDIVVDVDPAIYKCRTIKLILQPMVENALLHGIAEIDARGSVKVIGRDIGEDILFEIIDNGVGMEEERIKEIFEADVEEKKGYGIKNVDERIKLYYGENYGIKIFSEKGKGTRVEVKIHKIIK